jgi:hypothetical protein
MTTKETLLEQFTACYDENGWFVALKNALKNLTAEQAIWKTENLDNSIWEIVHHLNFYNARSRRTRRRLPPTKFSLSQFPYIVLYIFFGAKQMKRENPA